MVANGNEHDEYGDITEDGELTVLMQEKRAIKKLEAIKRDFIMPELVGKRDSNYLIVGWGSTYYPIMEAMEVLKREDLAFLHFKQVYPLKEEVKELFAGKTIIDVEGNVTGQFAGLLKRELGINVHKWILKYDGRPFSVEELVDRLKEVLE